LSIDDEEIATAKVFVHQWGKLASEKVKWDILAEWENANLCMPYIANHDPIQESPYNDNTTLGDLFSEHLMPDIKEKHA
jgi:hypothetical protein